MYTAPTPDAEESRAITLTNYPGKGMRGTAFLADLTLHETAKSTENYFTVTFSCEAIFKICQGW